MNEVKLGVTDQRRSPHFSATEVDDDATKPSPQNLSFAESARLRPRGHSSRKTSVAMEPSYFFNDVSSSKRASANVEASTRGRHDDRVVTILDTKIETFEETVNFVARNFDA